MRLPLTPTQTVGPFLHLVLPWPDGPDVVPAGTPGLLRIAGRVFDGAGAPVPDALVESWQADPDGRFAHPDDPRGAAPAGFRGFGRCPTDAEGRYAIHTVKPGRLPGGDGTVEAPHLNLSVFARGLLDRVVTRLYFPDEPAANAADPGRRAARSASRVVPRVQDLTALVPQPAAAFVPLGATSQDVLDTAASLVARRALVHVLGDLAAAADSCAAAARAHRDTVMVGRTMLQHAVPTTYGLKCAGWLVALDEAHAGLVAAGDRLAGQLGGVP